MVVQSRSSVEQRFTKASAGNRRCRLHNQLIETMDLSTKRSSAAASRNRSVRIARSSCFGWAAGELCSAGCVCLFSSPILCFFYFRAVILPFTSWHGKMSYHWAFQQIDHHCRIIRDVGGTLFWRMKQIVVSKEQQKKAETLFDCFFFKIPLSPTSISWICYHLYLCYIIYAGNTEKLHVLHIFQPDIRTLSSTDAIN